MAVATYTSTVYSANQPRARAYGASWVQGKMTYAGTVGDILFLAKVPHGATIRSFEEYHSSGETALALKFGFNKGIAAGGGANASCLIASGAIATMNRHSFAAAPGATPVHISLSDTDPVRFAVLQAKVASGTATISSSLTFALSYTMDETG